MPRAWARASVRLSIAYLMYAGIFLFLTLAVSAHLRKHARTTLMVLVGFWAFTGFLMPEGRQRNFEVHGSDSGIRQMDGRHEVRTSDAVSTARRRS